MDAAAKQLMRYGVVRAGGCDHDGCINLADQLVMRSTGPRLILSGD
jgi:hypothetical protein